MNQRQIQKIINEAGFIRISATPEEQKIADYLLNKCLEMGVDARIEDFEVPVAKINSAHLYADGKEIPCTAFEFSGSGEIEAPLVYIPAFDKVSLRKVKGKIVLFDGGFSKFDYHDMLDAGAVGYISYTGDVKWADRDIDTKELRSYVSDGRKALGVTVNAKDAFILAKNLPAVTIVIDQAELKGYSHNVVAEVPGLTDEWITVSCHLDSRPNAPGVYDNLSGCISNLAVLEEAKRTAPHRYGIRAVFCGSEERGLLGSKAYCNMHENELDKIALNLNVDMLGSVFGQVRVFCSCADCGVDIIRAFADELGYSVKVSSGVASSDSTAFADKGVPAISFIKFSPSSQAIIHARYDNAKVVSAKVMKEDVDFIVSLALRFADSYVCPIPREIPDKIKTQLDEYMFRKRKNI